MGPTECAPHCVYASVREVGRDGEGKREAERDVERYGAVEIVVNAQLWQTKGPILDITIKRSFQIFLGEKTELWLRTTVEVINGKK